jgi:hypothetical protein
MKQQRITRYFSRNQKCRVNSDGTRVGMVGNEGGLVGSSPVATNTIRNNNMIQVTIGYCMEKRLQSVALDLTIKHFL